MKKKKSFAELREQRLAANERLGDIFVKAANRELSAEEQVEVANLEREIKMCENEMRSLNLEAENGRVNAEREKFYKGQAFRELLQGVRSGKGEREILLNKASGNDTANIEASGAVNMTIHDLIPTLHEGMGLPIGLRIETGVVGNEIWPVSVNDVEMEEVGEVEALTDQKLDFAMIAPQSRRVGITIPVSNRAIDNAAFDLLAFVQHKITIAQREYLAKKIYSLAKWTGNKGPFSGLTAKSITLGADAYKNILAAVAEFSNEGFYEGDVCLSMDRVTEAELKATPKIAGAAGGFVIENGLCAGYPYTVSHFVNTELGSGGKLQATDGRHIEIGYWGWFALQQHDDVRLSIDSVSQGVAKRNITAITLNTAWSMTDLSAYINGNNPASKPSMAFALYKIED